MADKNLAKPILEPPPKSPAPDASPVEPAQLGPDLPQASPAIALQMQNTGQGNSMAQDLTSSQGAEVDAQSGEQAIAQPTSRKVLDEDMTNMRIEQFQNEAGLTITKTTWKSKGKVQYQFTSHGNRRYDLFDHDNPKKRDALNITDMQPDIEKRGETRSRKNSELVSRGFQFEGSETPDMSFDELGNVEITLPSGEKLVLDGTTGDEVVSGPFDLQQMDVTQTKDIDAEYTGDSLRSTRAKRGNFPRGYY